MAKKQKKAAKPAKKKTVKKVAKKAAGARKATARSNGKRPMSAAHKGALAEGRDQARIVREYLEALDANKPRRGRQVKPDDLRKKITALSTKKATARPGDRLQIVQARLDLEARLEDLETTVDIEPLRKKFIRVAKKYAATFPRINLVTIDEQFGGWQKAQKLHFADGGVFDQIYQPR